MEKPTKCLVCSLPSSGIHFGALTCDACAVFYRRAEARHLDYRCYFGGKCIESGPAGYHCSACRFKRCLEIGMHAPAPKPPKVKKGQSQKSENGVLDSQARERSDCNDFWNCLVTKELSSISPSNFSAKNSSRTELTGRTGHKLKEDMQNFDQKIVLYHNREKHLRKKKHAADRAEGKSSKSQNNMPQFLSDYWSTRIQEGIVIECTTNGISEAVEGAFRDIITLWMQFRNFTATGRARPMLLDVPIEEIGQPLADSMVEFVRRTTIFFTLLPGFRHFSEADQTVLLTEKFTDIWLVFHSLFMIDDDVSVMIGPRPHIQFSSSYFRQMVASDFRCHMLNLAREMNDIQLTDLERFLFLAVAIFHPDFTTVENKRLLTDLQSYYMHSLLHSIRSRCTSSKKTETEIKLQNFTRHFLGLFRIGKFYVSSLSFKDGQYKPSKGADVSTILEALTREDDGLPRNETPYSMVF